MTLSRASTYALYGLSYLVEHSGDDFVPLSTICAQYGLPEKHLAKIFQSLTKAGILRASRGPKGGFRLAKAPAKVSSLEIVQVIEGPFEEVACFLPRNPCRSISACTVAGVLRRLDHTRKQILRATMLTDLVMPRRPSPAQPGSGSG